MKAAVVGGGRGCRSLLELLLERGLTELRLEIELVCDVRSDAPGMLYAAAHGIKTTERLGDVFALPGIGLILELTGDDRIAKEIHHRLPAGIRMMDHALARVFWDLIQLEERLREERRQTRDILDSMPDVVMVLDREMRIVNVNARFCEFTGVSRAAALGRGCHDVLCRRDSAPGGPVVECPFERVLESGKRVDMIQVLERSPGVEEHFEITMTPIREPDGRINRVVESLHPISEQVRLSREVEVAARRFRRFIDSAEDFISMKDLEGRYQVVNAATALLFDTSPDDLMGRTVHELYPPEIADWISRHDREVIDKGEAIAFQETLVQEGREVFLNTRRFPLRDYRGDVSGVCSISRDVTEERRLQGQLVQADKLAAVGKLAAAVAHEINNPLTGILACAEDLEDELAANEEQAEDCRVIVRETLRCREIVRDLLDFARQTRPHFVKTDLNHVVERTIALVRRLAVFRDVQIGTDLAEDLPQVFGDPQQLQQVALNLLVNAAEGMNGKGAVEVTTLLREDRGECILRVADHGPGIAAETIGRIFEPFFSTKRSTHGLGLAVSWGIVERHGGRIEVENRESGGAEFRVILPVSGVSHE